ncbi:hypothetical protein JT254_00500 [Helicobacter pylori]|nr:hypothetical protein [Helicobacter pylori]
MKKHILSLTLGSLLVSALSAEDDGFYTSVGYQIGEAAQMVTNTKGIQQLSDNYENLSKLLTLSRTLASRKACSLTLARKPKCSI